MKFILFILIILNISGNENEIVKPNITIKIEKDRFHLDEKLCFDLVVTCDEPCLIDTGIFRRILPDNILYEFREIGNPENNVGVISAGYKESTYDFFFIIDGIFIGASHEIDLKKFDLSPGKYELKIIIPPNCLDPKLVRKILSENNMLDYTVFEGNIVSKTNIEIIRNHE